MNLEDFIIDEIFGERLLISKNADQTEINDNIRVAYVLLSCFEDMVIRINEHLLTIGHKNPEYTHMSESILKTKKIVSGCQGTSYWQILEQANHH